MEELRKLLNNIDDSYFEFVSAMEHYAQKNAERLEMLTAYIKRNPGVNFADDAAYMRVC